MGEEGEEGDDVVVLTVAHPVAGVAVLRVDGCGQSAHRPHVASPRAGAAGWTFLGARGPAVLVQIHHGADRGAVAGRGPSPGAGHRTVRRPITVTALDQFLRRHPSVADALAAFATQ